MKTEKFNSFRLSNMQNVAAVSLILKFVCTFFDCSVCPREYYAILCKCVRMPVSTLWLFRKPSFLAHGYTHTHTHASQLVNHNVCKNEFYAQYVSIPGPGPAKQLLLGDFLHF